MADDIEIKISRLTQRERQVMDLLVGGLSSIEIGDALKISRRTVEIHRASTLAKMDARNSIQATQIYMRNVIMKKGIALGRAQLAGDLFHQIKDLLEFAEIGAFDKKFRTILQDLHDKIAMNIEKPE